MDEAKDVFNVKLTSEKSQINFTEKPEQNPFDILSNLVKEEDTPWWRYLWKILSVVGSAAGVPPNVIFSNEFTEELFGKDQELLIIWAQIGSGGVNFAINFNSFEEIPDVFKKLPDLVKKVHRDIEECCGCSVSKTKILGALLVCFIINVGAFLSNLQFAKETSAKFSGPVWQGIVLYSQLVAAIALVFRSTFNIAVKKLLPEQQEAAEIIKERMLGEFNNCLSTKYSAVEIKSLASGKLTQGDSKNLSYALAALPIGVVLFYSGAFGVSAFQATAALVGETSIWAKGLSFFGAGASFVAKTFLLSNSVLDMTAIIAKSCDEDILSEELSGSTVANIAGASVLFLTLVWNTSFGASWVVQEHLLKLMTDNVRIQMIVSGVTGAIAALPINFLDSFLLGKKWLEKAVDICCPQKNGQYEIYIKGLMKAIAEMPCDEVMRRFVGEKYHCISDAMEAGVLVHQDDSTHQGVFDKMGAVLNETFFETLKALSELSAKNQFDKQALYEVLAEIPRSALTNILIDQQGESRPLLNPSPVSSGSGTPRTPSSDGGNTTPNTHRLKKFDSDLAVIVEGADSEKGVVSSESNSPRPSQ